MTYTATVVGSGNLVPTGTVTFEDSGTALYSPVRLNASGVAVYTNSTLSAATHSITASYSGDSNYSAATSSVLTEIIVPAPASDYTLTVPEASQTVQTGSSTNYTITITPINGYNGTITFSCVGLPSGATCAFSPDSVTPNNTEVEVVSSLEVTTGTTTTTTSNSKPRPHSRSRAGMLALCFGVLGVLCLGIPSSRRMKSGILPLCLLFILGLSGCGGSNNSTAGDVAVGTYTFTVNATGTAGTNGGNTSLHQLSLTLVVTTATSS